MPLDKVEVRVPFGGGLDSKTDHKQVIPGQLLELKNGVFSDLKQITKRNGFLTPFSLMTVDTTLIDSGNSIYRRGKELLVTGLQSQTTGRFAWEDGGKMFSHGPDENEWKTIGDRDPIALDVDHIAPPNALNVIPDVALADDEKYACYAWLHLKDPNDATTQRHGRATVKELANDVNIIDNWDFGTAPIAAVDVEGIHVVGIDATNPIFYVWLAVPSTNDIYCAQINCLTLSAAGAPVVKITDLHTDMVWDVCTATHTVHGECSVVAYKDEDGFLTVKWFDQNAALQATRTGTMAIKNACTVYEENDRLTTSDKVLTAYQQNVNGFIYGTTFNANDTLYTGWDFQIYGADAGDVHNITGCKDTAADNNFMATRSYVRVYVEVEDNTLGAPAFWHSSILQLQHEFDGTNPATLARMRHCGLASKAFEYWNRPRVWVCHDSTGAVTDTITYSTTMQNTYFLQSPWDNGLVYDRTDARCLGGEAGGISFSQSISAVVSPEAHQYIFAGLRQDVIARPPLAVGGAAETFDSVVGIYTEYRQYAQPGTELGPTLQTGGGFVGDADGRFAELGFHLYPMIPDITVLANGVSGTDADWQYVAVYEWTDREGQRHQSAPSVPFSVHATHLDDHVIIDVMTLTFGEWDKLYESTRVVIYRTTDEGSVFYRLPISVHPYNNPILYTVSAYDLPPTPLTDATLDADLINYETLYTGSLIGGVWDVVENICPPATQIMNVRQDRVFLVSDDDKTNIWFSKIKRHEAGVSFSDLFTKRVSDGGDITALITMDNREIVFKASEIRAFSGSGPIDTGVGSFGEDYMITSDVGCVDRASVCWTDKGIMFKSNKGIYLLGRNLQASYVGAPVEEYNNYKVLKATLVEDKNQVRFLLEEQSMLVYDYLVNQWSVFEAHQSGEEFDAWNTVDSCIWQDNYVMIQDGGVVYREGATWVDTINTYVPLDLTTSWIKLTGLQGYQRVWWISLLGEIYTQCTINYEIYYDYVDANPQTGSVVIDADFAANPPAQFRVKPRYGNGKCQAFKIRLWDEEADVPAGTQKGYSISDIMVQIGKKPGVMRQGTLKTR